MSGKKIAMIIGGSVLGVLVLLVAAAIVVPAGIGKYKRRHFANTAPLRVAETAQTEARVQARETVNDAPAAVPVDLSAYTNAALTDSIHCNVGVKGNDLAALPPGTNVYAGVAFNVAGIVQLKGQSLVKHGKTQYPERVADITIGQACVKIHLLHGASDVNTGPIGLPIAKLVLHYQDGSRAELPIISGQNLNDFWGPIANTAEPGRWLEHPQDKNSELAWVGVNPYIKKWQPEWRLRIYRTTFANPRPGKEIVSLDYVSTMEKASHFMLGLSVE